MFNILDNLWGRRSCCVINQRQREDLLPFLSFLPRVLRRMTSNQKRGENIMIKMVQVQIGVKIIYDQESASSDLWGIEELWRMGGVLWDGNGQVLHILRKE